jgi:hypothetical protein
LFQVCHLEADVGGERRSAGVDGKDFGARGSVRRRDEDEAVEPPRPQQRRVAAVRAVCGADDDNAAAWLRIGATQHSASCTAKRS